MIYGYARKLDCARMINSFHLLLAALQLRVYFEWVPSEANIDLMVGKLVLHISKVYKSSLTILKLRGWKGVCHPISGSNSKIHPRTDAAESILFTALRRGEFSVIWVRHLIKTSWRDHFFCCQCAQY